MNIPTLNSSTFKQREREVGKAVEIVAKLAVKNLSMKRGHRHSAVGPNLMKKIWFQCTALLIWVGKSVVKGTIPVLAMLQS